MVVVYRTTVQNGDAIQRSMRLGRGISPPACKTRTLPTPSRQSRHQLAQKFQNATKPGFSKSLSKNHDVHKRSPSPGGRRHNMALPATQNWITKASSQMKIQEEQENKITTKKITQTLRLSLRHFILGAPIQSL